MIKSKLFILVLFVLTLGAGTTAGMLVERKETCAHQSTPLPLLLQDLHLTTEQEVKMRDIWQPVFNKHWERKVRRETILKEKDDATLTILNEDQKKQFAEVQKKFDDRLQQLEQEIKNGDDQAVVETNKILNEQQRAKFAEIRKAREDAMNPKPK